MRERAEEDEESDNALSGKYDFNGSVGATPGRSAASYSGAGESVRGVAIVGGGAEQGAGAARVAGLFFRSARIVRSTSGGESYTDQVWVFDTKDDGWKKARPVVLGNLDDYKEPTYAPTAVRCVMC